MKICIFIILFCIVNIIFGRHEEKIEPSYEVIKEGKGVQTVGFGDTLIFHIKSFDEKGELIGTSKENKKPFTMVVGTGQIIPGFDDLIVGIKVGEVRRCTVPYSLDAGSDYTIEEAPKYTAFRCEVNCLEIINQVKTDL